MSRVRGRSRATNPGEPLLRLLLDQNLSPRLIPRLADVYPEATHVSLVGLDRATDEVVWEYARAYDCIIVTKDADFGDLAVLRGFVNGPQFRSN